MSLYSLYYKFRSAKDYESIQITGPFISVANLKDKIFVSKQLGIGTDVILTNAQTNEEYLNEEMLIPQNTSVLVQRVPGRLGLPIVIADKPRLENRYEEVLPVNSSFTRPDLSVTEYPHDFEPYEFGDDVYAIPEISPVQPSNIVLDAPPSSKDGKHSKIKALIEMPAPDWQCQTSNDSGSSRCFGPGVAGRMVSGRSFGRVGFERKTPPQGYVCHRCQVPGHFIQHCPTNGDPKFDIKRAKPPIGIPKSMLMTTLDGSAALANGFSVKPNEALFEKEMEGLLSTHSVGDLPPELHCPLCNKVMKDASLTSKCCFRSFCAKCIRDLVILKSQCVCGATNVLVDDLVPNQTLRDTINRIMESSSSCAENSGSSIQVHVMESHNGQPKIPSPTQSDVSNGEQVPPPQNEEIVKIHEAVELAKAVSSLHEMTENGRSSEVAEVSKNRDKPGSVKELAPHKKPKKEVERKPDSTDTGKKNKMKKGRLPLSEMQWNTSQGLGAEKFTMNMGHPVYNPYWNGMHPEIEGCMVPYAGVMSYMGNGFGPFDVALGNVLPQDPFVAQGFMLPFVSQQRDFSKDNEFARDKCSGDNTSVKPKSNAISSSPTSNQHHSKRVATKHNVREFDYRCPYLKRKSDFDHQCHDDQYKEEEWRCRGSDFSVASAKLYPRPLKSSVMDITSRKQKQANVSSRISSCDCKEDAAVAPKKQKVSSSSEVRSSHSRRRSTSYGYHHEAEDHKKVLSRQDEERHARDKW